MKLIEKEEKGVILFLNYNESQSKLKNTLAAKKNKNKQDELRNYGIGSQILVDIGITKMRLLASPRKMPSMAGYGLQVTEFIDNN